MTATTIYGREIAVKLDSYIVPEGWRFGGRLQASNWEAAQFYLPTNSGGPVESLAVNVQITGKTLQRRNGSSMVKVKIEFVGDGEPSTFTGGWMLVN